MPLLQIRNQEQILQRMATRLVARTELTDLTDSSVLKQILAAVARECDDIYYGFTRLRDLFDLRKAVRDDLDARAKEIQPGTLTRYGARKAIGRVVFSRASNTGSTLVVAARTTVKSSDGQAFTTTEVAYITATSAQQITGHGVGRDSNQVLAVAQTAGADGNVGAGAVVAFQAKPVGLAEVTNVTSFTQGRDREPDDEFRARIIDFIASLPRGTIEALESAVRGVEDDNGKRVVFAHVYEDPTQLGNVTLYVDDGAGTAAEIGSQIIDELVLSPALGGEEFMYLDYAPISLSSGFTLKLTRGSTYVLTSGVDYFLNPASGQLFVPMPTYSGIQTGDVIKATYYPYENLIPVAQKVIDGDPDDRLNYPGYRAAGVRVVVAAPDVVTISVQATISVSSGFDLSNAALDATTAVLDYINNLGISGDVIRHEIIERIMDVDGVYDVNLISPTANIVINDDQVARSSTSAVSVG